LIVLACVLVAIRLVHVSNSFVSSRLKVVLFVSDADAVELFVPSVELVDCMSCNTSENALLALVRSPDERASLRDLRSLINASEPLVELVDVDALEVLVLSEAVASGGCICCMICARMVCALVVSPDWRASPSLLRSLARGLESVLDEDAVVELVPDVDAVEVLVLSEAVASGGCICCMICARMVCALVRSPDWRASSSLFRSLARGLELVLVLDADVVEALVLLEVVVSGGGCMCCVICARMLWALVVSPDEMAFSNELRSLASGLESMLPLDVDEAVELVVSVELTACTSCNSCENALWAFERLPASRACISVFSSVLIVSELLVDSTAVVVSELVDDDFFCILNNLKRSYRLLLDEIADIDIINVLLLIVYLSW
jgi:hypothetical protein